jgi:sigma-B regulation protein RsbU (phosphoserine phosphatase)
MPSSDDIEDFEDLYENAPCGYLSLRANGIIAKSNRTFSLWTGYELAELQQKKFHDLLNLAGRIYYETHFAPLLRMQGRFDEVALEILKKDGGRLAVLVNAAERRDAEGKPLFIRLTIFNATDRRRYERDLVNARDEFKRLNANLETRVTEVVADRLQADTALKSQREEAELREQFIAVLSHDLRNPLASISAGVRILQRKLDAGDASVLTMMQKSVLRMAGLIDNVMDFARGRLGGGIIINPADLPLEPTLRQVVDELQSVHPEVAIKAKFDLDKPVIVDHVRIAQLFSNLLGNALTHGLEGGVVSVKAITTDKFELEVCNRGDPIPPEAIERLFLPFSRAGAARSNQQGLGLGLFIASQIAQAHGGRIDVTSTPELTCFTFRMPL